MWLFSHESSKSQSKKKGPPKPDWERRGQTPICLWKPRCTGRTAHQAVHQVSASPQGMGMSRAGHLKLLVQQESGLGRGELYPACLWGPCVAVAHRAIEMSHDKAASETQVLAVTQEWSAEVGAGLYPGHCPPSRIKIREVLSTLATLLGFCHCQVVSSCFWRDS